MSVLFAFSMIATILMNQPTIQPVHSSIRVFDAIPRSNRLLINFSAGCGYWTYYLGIAKFIQDNYDLDEVDFVGTSAGAFPSSLLSFRVPIGDIFCLLHQHLDRCRTKVFGVFGYWNISYRRAILDLCRHFDVKPRRNNYIGVSILTPTGFRKLYFDCGASHETVATSIIASCWIPIITAPVIQPLLRIGNYYYGDGFWSGKDKSNHEKQLVIYPNCFGRLPLYTYWLWLGENYHMKMFNSGYEDAAKNRHVFDEFFFHDTIS